MVPSEPLHMPFRRTTLIELPDTYRELHRLDRLVSVLTPAGDPAWLATRHAHVKELLGDLRLASTHPDPRSAPRYTSPAPFELEIASSSDADQLHAAWRSAFRETFTPNRVARFRPAIRNITEHLVRAVRTSCQPVDLNEPVAVRLPMAVVCVLLGAPHSDGERLVGWMDWIAAAADLTTLDSGLATLATYLEDQLAARRAMPGDDVLSELVINYDRTKRLTHVDLMRFVGGLLFAGYHMMRTAVGYGLLALLGHPDQYEVLCRHPAIVPRAVDEVLRFVLGGTDGVLTRYARFGFEYRGADIHAGDLVLLATRAANRDPEVFADPERFDINRTPMTQLALGHGLRSCLGASLARLELEQVLLAVTRHFPAMRIAVPLREIRELDGLGSGLASLPVTWWSA